MDNLTQFDVLVVYSSYAARSASSKKNYPTPFSHSRIRTGYDASYSYFLKTCKASKLRAAFTTSADITGPGEFSSYWLFVGSHWKRVNKPGFATVVFDKLSPFNAKQKRRRDLLFSAPHVQPFNDPQLYQLFFDKLSTYQSLSYSSIPTVSVPHLLTGKLADSVAQLKLLMQLSEYPGDFGEGYVLKNRHGSAGLHVYRVHTLKQIRSILKSHPRLKFVLQPVVKFDTGYNYKNFTGKTEIRLIFMDETIVQTYVRIAPKDDFRCNDHQGGNSIYIKISDVPENVLNAAADIIDQLPPHDSLFALDFLVSNGGNPYLLEGNTGPGLNWNPAKRIEVIKTHQLIKTIVAQLAKRVKKHSVSQFEQEATALTYL